MNAMQVDTKEISYIGARLREKSTYAGLAAVVGFFLPIVAPKLGLAGASVDSVVMAISYLGMGAGAVIAIFLPENGSAT